jgi:hypothetical protein
MKKTNPPNNGMHASAAAMFGGSPVNLEEGAAAGGGMGFGGGAGLIGSGMLHLEKRRPVLSR